MSERCTRRLTCLRPDLLTSTASERNACAVRPVGLSADSTFRPQLPGVCMTNEPKRFEVHESGALLHGTKADLAVGGLLVPGRLSNFEEGRIMNHLYVTQTLDAATWGAELAAGEGRGRIYIVEPTGALEDDPT